MFDFLKRSASKKKDASALLYKTELLKEQFRSMADWDLQDRFRMNVQQALSDGPEKEDAFAELYALCAEAYARVIGGEFFGEQKLGADVLCSGKIAVIAFPDNKNAAVIVAALTLAASGKKVWILSSNPYEVKKNADVYGGLARFFGLSAAVVTAASDPQKRAEAYRAAVVYAEAAVFGPDYVHFLADPAAFTGMKDLDAAIVDGAETVLIENADVLCRYQEKGRLSERYLGSIIRDFGFCCGTAVSVLGQESIYKEAYGLEVGRVPKMRPDVNLCAPDKVFRTAAECSAKAAAHAAERVRTPGKDGLLPAVVLNTFDLDAFDLMVRLLRQEGVEPVLYSPYMAPSLQEEAVRGMTAPGRVTVALELDQNRILPEPEDWLSGVLPAAELELISIGHAPTRSRDRMLLSQVADRPGTSCFYCDGSEDRQKNREEELKANVLRAVRGEKPRTVEESKSKYGWDAPAAGLVAKSPLPAYTGAEPFLFVSYAHADSEAVGKLIEGLQKKGYRVWWDLSIPFGEEWEKELFDRIRSCSTVLAFVSEEYLARKYTNVEIDYATESLDPSKPCLLALIEDVALPDRYLTRFGKSQFAESRRFAGMQEFIDYIAASPQIGDCKGE